VVVLKDLTTAKAPQAPDPTTTISRQSQRRRGCTFRPALPLYAISADMWEHDSIVCEGCLRTNPTTVQQVQACAPSSTAPVEAAAAAEPLAVQKG
jgi:hypothetical protein